MKFQLPVTMDTANRKKDKSVSLKFTTNTELTTAEYMVLDAALQRSGWLLFADNELQDGDIPDEPAREREGKSKGQRLRAVFFLLWKKSGTDEAFDPWFDRKFETLLDYYKEKLD